MGHQSQHQRLCHISPNFGPETINFKKCLPHEYPYSGFQYPCLTPYQLIQSTVCASKTLNPKPQTRLKASALQLLRHQEGGPAFGICSFKVCLGLRAVLGFRIQIVQCREYLQTLGPDVCIVCILGSLGFQRFCSRQECSVR